LLAWTLVAVPGLASAQEYPDRPITFVVAYPPGGGADAIGRLLAQKLADSLGKPVVVENKPGFSGNIGAQYVAKSKPDGHTLLVAPWTTYSINSLLYPGKLGYAIDKDFQPISIVGYLPLVLMVNSSLNVASASELIALAKSRPGALSYGSTGPGSLEHIAAELFKRQTQTDMVHVPYKGSGPAISDLMGGQIQVFFITAPTAVANAGSDKIKSLMLTTNKRSPALPNLVTPNEAGVAGFEVFSTYGLLAPAGTPPAIVKRLNGELVKILQEPEVKAKFLKLGVDANPSTPEEAAQRISGDLAKWGKVIKDSNITVD
jgi:tripartite-type tricarboxylate transporter receptor subunit TctC